jgi:hypothetical protein
VPRAHLRVWLRCGDRLRARMWKAALKRMPQRHRHY